MAVVTMRQLLESGVHFGHQTRRWNPKMKRFIFTERNGIYIIDLQQSLSYIDRAYEFVKETVAHGGTIMFVGTKKQAQEADRRAGHPRRHALRQPALAGWHAHQLLRPSTSACSASRSSRRSTSRTSPPPASPRRSSWSCRARRTKLEKTLGGIRDMAKVPSAVWIVDTKKEHLAVGEARKLGIPVVAILDTNCDPDEVDYPIPGNDDAIRSVTLLTRVIADAVAEGLMARSGAPPATRARGRRPSRWPSGSATCSRATEARPTSAEAPAAEAAGRRGSRGRGADGGSAAAPRLPPRPPAAAEAPAAEAAAASQTAEQALTRSPPSSSTAGRRRAGAAAAVRPVRPPRLRDREVTTMANYTAADVKALRELTGAGMMDCKKALDEAEGDVDKAVEILRVKGLKGVAKREGRSAAERPGRSPRSTARVGVLVELNCETDFVAKGDKFLAVGRQGPRRRRRRRPADLEALLATESTARPSRRSSTRPTPPSARRSSLRRFARVAGGYVAAYLHRTSQDLPPQVGVLVALTTSDRRRGRQDVAQHIAAFAPKYLTREEVPADVVENERRIAEETARDEGKPEAALPKIVEGRLNGFFKENVLLDQAFAKDNKKTVAQVLDEAGVTLSASRASGSA